jgi:alpha-mannosidase
MPFHNAAEERLYFQRIERAYGRLKDRYILASVPFTAEVAMLPPHTRPVFKDRPKSGYAPIAEGAEWGKNWSSAWFKLSGTVPQEWAGKEVQAWCEITGEGLLFDTQGNALQGITSGSVFDHGAARPFMPLYKAAKGGEQVELWLEGAANHLFGLSPGGDPTLQDERKYGHMVCKVNKLRLAALDTDVWALRHDFEILIDLYRNLPENSVRRARILRALTKSCEVLAKDETAYGPARAELKEVQSKPANASDIPVRAVGHAHIDTAWLWPLGETVRKTARTYASQLKLIEQYPGYVFGASAPQHYDWMKKDYPDIYARVKEAVKAGRWELQGGMWVEADCNVPNGESLVRQFIHGKNFYRDEFGQDVDNLWIPDVFGYAASLPQIMEKCGVTTFLTQKISWNQFNEFPYHTFWWQGIDGSRILTHFPPENTYNGDMLPWSLIQGQGRFKEKDIVNEVMSLFGIGDGGGGPRAEHLERASRIANLEGCPPVRYGSAREFFNNLRKAGPDLNSWVGELYLELHRGTLTTQAYVKKCNRKLEHRLRELEMLWTSQLGRYPLAALDALWKETLTLQFHDIIPGSSINRVYVETNAAHNRLLATCDQLEKDFAATLPAQAGSATVFNSLSEPYVGAVTLPASFAGRNVVGPDGAAVPSQTEDGVVVALVTIPAQGFLTLKPGAQAPAATNAGSGLVLENDMVKYVFAADGTVTSAYDKQLGAELLAGPANKMTLYHDRPNNWDAWDIDKFYQQEKLADVAFSVERISGGAVRNRLRLSGKVGSSTVTQIVSLAAGSRRLDFATTVDWKERSRMLRVAFPAAFRTDRVACEIQYGHLFRPTHTNTSWDMARFEAPAQRWVDLSARDRGLALLNDCKYGHAVNGSVIDLNLLRSPSNPDPDADTGVHTFTYSLLPHPGDLLDSGVVREAGRLNQPPVVLADRGAPAAAIPVTITGADGVELAVVKRAEKSDQVVIRLAETRGVSSKAVIRLAKPGKLIPTDLLEWKDGAAGAVASEHAVTLTPFELRTYKLG